MSPLTPDKVMICTRIPTMVMVLTTGSKPFSVLDRICLGESFVGDIAITEIAANEKASGKPITGM
jgi:hypothetical protein